MKTRPNNREVLPSEDSRRAASAVWGPAAAERRASPCFHGGAFFDAVGERFDSLEKREAVINADVLDAWFPPAPGVMAALREHLAWITRTSPPTGCEGLVATISERRGVPVDCVLPGGGSSDLIFLALPRWLHAGSRVLLPDPTYGEYAHVLREVVGCHVDLLPWEADRGYHADPVRLARALERGYDLAIIVNPNSPVGDHMARSELEDVIRRAPTQTRFWIDETYVEYVGTQASLEKFAVSMPNVVVCKSMSKVYALSGVRVAYLCASAALLSDLRRFSPPWAVSLPGQIAAVEALQDPDYYEGRYAETHELRDRLSQDLKSLGFAVQPSVANFLLCHVPARGPTAGELIAACAGRGLFLRDPAATSPRMGERVVRIAVKDAAMNQRLVRILGSVR